MIVNIKIKEVSFNTVDIGQGALLPERLNVWGAHQDVIRPFMNWDIQGVLFFSPIQKLHSNRRKSVVYKK